MNQEPVPENASTDQRIKRIASIVLAITITFLLGVGSGYFTWGRDETAASKQEKELTQLYAQVNPAKGYVLPVSYGWPWYRWRGDIL